MLLLTSQVSRRQITELVCIVDIKVAKILLHSVIALSLDLMVKNTPCPVWTFDNIWRLEPH